MCGIAGVLSANINQNTSSTIQHMTAALNHRGPNGNGTFINQTQHIALGHTRLSIIDLSNQAAQPMQYQNRYTIIHNGEVYNYIELRNTLKALGYNFISNSDTEVIVAAYAHWQHECVSHFDGMFAFAIWDDVEQQLFLAKDRFGEKQLYIYELDNALYFASEIKSFWAAGLPKQINQSMLCTYLGSGFTNIALQPQISFYKNVISLPAAHYLKASVVNQTINVETTQYWDLNKVTQSNLNEADAIEQLHAMLTQSIQHRLRSDVTVGTSLSGGLDSTSIASILSHKTQHKAYQTFSAVFPGYDFDESKTINDFCKTHHLSNHQVALTANDFNSDFDHLIQTQEQPFISSSVYAQYKVAELAKQHNINVLLDGQGADETLAGYRKYINWYLQELFLFDKKRFYSEQKLYNQPFDLANKMAAWFPAAASTQLHKKAVNQLRNKSYLNPDYVETNFSKLFIYKPLVKKLNDALYYNMMQFHFDELLRYADKNSMAHGVEVRLPFLQHELVQFIFSLPTHLKIKEGYQKYILRKAMDTQLPKNIVWNKKKIGYQTPQHDWLNTPTMIERVHAAQAKLVSAGILQKTAAQKNKNAELTWRWLIAAQYL